MDGKSWQFLVHRHHTGKLMIRLDCIAITNNRKTNVKMIGRLTTGEEAEKTWSFGLFSTEDLIFDVSLASLPQIEATVQLQLNSNDNE